MHTTREAWLQDVATRLQPVFKAAGAPIPGRVRVAIGFPSHGSKGKQIGECWDSAASADRTFEILIRPDLDDPARVADVLAHELVHASVGLEAAHGAPFRRVAKAIGLEGKMRATTAGPRLLATLAPILDAVGPLPHAALGFGRSTAPKKQTSRMIKVECDDCGYVARVARAWLETAGPPHCPRHGAMSEAGE